jgi:hypothetical protein
MAEACAVLSEVTLPEVLSEVTLPEDVNAHTGTDEGSAVAFVTATVSTVEEAGDGAGGAASEASSRQIRPPEDEAETPGTSVSEAPVSAISEAPVAAISEVRAAVSEAPVSSIPTTVSEAPVPGAESAHRQTPPPLPEEGVVASAAVGTVEARQGHAGWCASAAAADAGSEKATASVAATELATAVVVSVGDHSRNPEVRNSEDANFAEGRPSESVPVVEDSKLVVEDSKLVSTVRLYGIS